MTFQDQEDRDYELNAAYDYMHEAFGGECESIDSLLSEAIDCAREAAEEAAAFIGPRRPVVVDADDCIPF